jgi:hypothetical protein
LTAEGQPALNQFRMTAHCVRDEPRGSTPLRITHRWTEAGAPRENVVELTDRGDYEFEAGIDPVNESLELTVVSEKQYQTRPEASLRPSSFINQIMRGASCRAKHQSS